MIIYQKLWSLERTLDRAGVLGLFPPEVVHESLLVRPCCSGACPGGGGPRGLAPPPPQKLKCKKKSSEQILCYFTHIPIFCYFFIRKYHFVSYFLTWAEKKALKFWAPPPLRIPGHAPAAVSLLLTTFVYSYVFVYLTIP